MALCAFSSAACELSIIPQMHAKKLTAARTLCRRGCSAKTASDTTRTPVEFMGLGLTGT